MYYARSLIPAYPDAKVILVERELDSWLLSWKARKGSWYSPYAHQFVKTMGPLTGVVAGQVSFKFTTGWIGSNKRQDIFDQAGKAYIQLNKGVRESVPAGQLLGYKLTDGWKPLCRFLGSEVPDVPFPRLNVLEA